MIITESQNYYNLTVRYQIEINNDPKMFIETTYNVIYRSNKWGDFISYFIDLLIKEKYSKSAVENDDDFLMSVMK